LRKRFEDLAQTYTATISEMVDLESQQEQLLKGHMDNYDDLDDAFEHLIPGAFRADVRHRLKKMK
jgi:hypothetical protein